MNKQILLTVARLADMKRVHPAQIESKCERCGHVVGIYPSGQLVLSAYPGQVEIVCSICHTPSAEAMLAPGAEIEPFQSHRKNQS